MRSAILAALVAFTVSAAGRAQTCPLMAGSSPGLAQFDTQTRLAFVRQQLLQDGFYAKRWWYGWTIGYGAFESVELSLAIAGSTAPYPKGISPADQRNQTFVNLLRSNSVQLYDGAATTLVGIIVLLVSPPHSIFDGPAFDRKLAGHPTEDVCTLLAEGERLLMRAASDEELAHTWPMHVGNVGLNLAAGLILGVFFKQWVNGVLNFVIGTAVGEAMIFSEPLGSSIALNQYQAGKLGPVAGPPKVTLEVMGNSLALHF